MALLQSPRSIFLLDGLGGCLSAFFLGYVLVRWESHFGMPPSVLYILAGLAVCFALYSLSCAFFLKKDWKPFLKAVMFANMTYCILTFVLLVLHFEHITTLGVLYFIGEILVILAVVWIEWRAINRPTPPQNPSKPN